jgi:hypothetical protein
VRGTVFSLRLPFESGALAFAILVIFGAAPVEAQIIPWPSIAANPNKPLYEQPHPGYDPMGTNVGSFLFKPSFAEGVIYDDNIFASEIHPASDVINATDEEFSFESQWPRDHLSVDLQSEQAVYTRNPPESANTYIGTVVGRYDLSSDGYLEFDGYGGQKPQIRASEQAFQPLGHRPIYNVWAGSLTYLQRVGQLVNEFRMTINQNAFIYLQNIYQSNTDKIVGDRLSLDHGQTLVPFVEVGYDMNSQVFQPKLQNFHNLTGLVGVQSHIDTLLDAEISAGFLRETYRNPLFQPQLGPIVNGKLLWNVTPLTSIIGNVLFDYSGVESFCNTGLVCQIDLSGNKEPVNSANPPGQLLFTTHRSTVQRLISEISVQHEIWHDVLGEVEAGYQHFAFDFNGLTDNYYVLGGNVRYLVNNYSEIRASYEYRARSANQPADFTFNTGPFKEDTLSMKVILQL